MPITVTRRPFEATRTANSPCSWIAEATIESRTYTAGARHGAPNELAAAGRRRVRRSADGDPLSGPRREHDLPLVPRRGDMDLQRREPAFAPRQVQTAAGRDLPWERGKAKMRFIAGGR